MSHHERCYHTTAPVALARDGIRRMESCLGVAFDRHFVSALVARLPGIAEQGRARTTRNRGLRVYAGALEHAPVRRVDPAEDLAGLPASPSRLPRLPIPRISAGV